MTASWIYWNPVRIDFGVDRFDHVGEKIAGLPYCLITYPDDGFSPLIDRLLSQAGQLACLIRNVEPNPSYASLDGICRTFASAKTKPEVIVALGGGSAMDTAKVVAAANGDFARVRHYIETGKGADELGCVPIIAVPTTSGTGSEVTCWATVWDMANKKKYSLARPMLYPKAAVVDPRLTLALPRSLTISTGLDALSHALESIWNLNANPVSSSHAVSAAREVLACLPDLAQRLDDLDLRSRMARAAMTAGLAFSNTKTALAHSLSYHFTLNYGTPHGIACSFTLPLVMQSAIGRSQACDMALREIFGPDLPGGIARLGHFIESLGVPRRAADYGVTQPEWRAVIADAFEGERGRNFIGSLDVMLGTA